MRAIIGATLLGGVALLTSGCGSMWHEIKPHRLQRWNHGTNGMPDEDWTLNDRTDEAPVYFASIPDDLG